ncbi:chondroitinase-B domain-containing protein [Sphingobacterium sp. SGR-19]|uniref:chondroitinase-B domain-containing protein n=1 Tax=Sphingobacterium sp. SGR-19 TaxID=2710886 RepID=UPI0013EA358A|nr:chondroitinase-B domain-containing protein [Sphingobacterium sp. SGR-19]NGM67221.1 hypothetical protein [Sphingobacterium sp. SGR-19]
MNRFYLTVLGILFLAVCNAKVINVQAVPGGIYYVSGDNRDLQIVVKGKGTETRPFVIRPRSKDAIMRGNSFIKLDNQCANIIIRDLTFEDNVIQYKSSTSLIEIGRSKKSTVTNIRIENVEFRSRNGFKDRDKETQFHWINIFGNNVVINKCRFSGKRNRLPIIHVNSNFDNNVIRDNIFQDVPSRAAGALEAIRVGLADGDSDVRIVGNSFINYHGDSETISIKANGAVLSDNTFINSRSGISIRYGNNCDIVNNTFSNTVTPIRIAGSNHRIVGNTFNKNKKDASITFMVGGKSYPNVENIEISRNQFNLKNVTFNCIQFPNHHSFPSDIRLSQNYQNGIPLENKHTNIENNRIATKNKRSDNTVLYTYDF